MDDCMLRILALRWRSIAKLSLLATGIIILVLYLNEHLQTFTYFNKYSGSQHEGDKLTWRDSLNNAPGSRIRSHDLKMCLDADIHHRKRESTCNFKKGGCGYGLCQPDVPSAESCVLAWKLFGKGHIETECPPVKNICSKTDTQYQQERVKCDLNQCSHGSGEVGEMSLVSGDIIWRVHRAAKSMEADIRRTSNSFGFVYIRCSRRPTNKTRFIDNAGDGFTFQSEEEVEDRAGDNGQRGEAQVLLVGVQLPNHDQLKTGRRNGKAIDGVNSENSPTSDTPGDGKGLANLPISVNLILIDSVSQRHFYRSLPETVQLLQKLNMRSTNHRHEDPKVKGHDQNPKGQRFQKRESSKFFKSVLGPKNDNRKVMQQSNGREAASDNGSAEVLFFDLFQAVKGRTFESMVALFEGRVPKGAPFGTQEMPSEPLRVDELFGTLKDRGYSTFFIEDLCWLWEWGTAKDLHVHDPADKTPDESMSPNAIRRARWKRFLKVMRLRAIDSVGISPTACPMLRSTGHPDPFHNVPLVCTGSREQQDVNFSALKRLQTGYSVGTLKNGSRPFVSFYASNVGHDESGTRIQTLDSTLKKYVEFLAGVDITKADHEQSTPDAAQPHAITFIFSDHGNTYGSYVQSEAGRVEMFHPFLIAIVPRSVSQQIGSDWMAALRANQYRLTSFIDVHHSIRAITERLGHKARFQSSTGPPLRPDRLPLGLFDEISPNRTCRDISLLYPNVCVCKGHQIRVPNDTSRVVFAEFALGQLNNELSRQQRLVGTRRCHRLSMATYENPLESSYTNPVGGLVTSLQFDLNVRPPNSEKRETFFVTVTKTESPDTVEDAARFTLVNYERVTSYGEFSACSDKGVTGPLCTCIRSQEKAQPRDVRFLSLNVMNFGDTLPVEMAVRGTGQKCLFLYIRSDGVTVTFEITNQCTVGVSGGFKIQFATSCSFNKLGSLSEASMRITTEVWGMEEMYLLSCAIGTADYDNEQSQSGDPQYMLLATGL